MRCLGSCDAFLCKILRYRRQLCACPCSQASHAPPSPPRSDVGPPPLGHAVGGVVPATVDALLRWRLARAAGARREAVRRAVVPVHGRAEGQRRQRRHDVRRRPAQGEDPRRGHEGQHRRAARRVALHDAAGARRRSPCSCWVERRARHRRHRTAREAHEVRRLHGRQRHLRDFEKGHPHRGGGLGCSRCLGWRTGSQRPRGSGC
mmetsp:Transcript_5750/g.17767  ORF Transcript_5750/g.17767 Transcript_5750/m.17767 type:complete len:205 (-) Transcript_5750:1191-1805(-)